MPAERMRRMNEILDEGSGVFHLEPAKSGPTLLTGLPFAFVPHERASFGSTPRLGEQTEDALKEWLSLDPAEIETLRDMGALV